MIKILFRIPLQITALLCCFSSISSAQVADSNISAFNECKKFSSAGKQEAALECYKAVLRKLELQENDSLKFRTYVKISLMYGYLDDYQKSLLYSDSSLQISHAIEGELHLAKVLDNQAQAYIQLGNLEKGENNLKKSLAIRLAQNDSAGMATSYSILAKFFAVTGKIEDAVGFAHKSLDLNLMLMGKNSDKVSRNHQTLARLYANMLSHKKAIVSFNKALDITDQLHGKDNHRAIEILQGLGHSHTSLGNNLQAEKCLLRALYIYKEHYPEEKRYILSAINGTLAQLYVNKQEILKALDYGKKNLELTTSIFKNNPRYAISSYQLIGQLYGYIGDLEALNENFNKAIEIVMQTYGGNALALSDIHTHKGNILIKKEYYKEGISSLQKALDALEASSDSPVIQKGNILYLCALAHHKTNKIDSALSLYIQAYDLAKTAVESNNRMLISIQTNLANIYMEKGDLRHAEIALKSIERAYHFNLSTSISLENQHNLDHLISYLEAKGSYFKKQVGKNTNYKDSISLVRQYQLKAIEAKNTELSADESRDYYNEKNHVYYEQAIEHFFNLDEKNQTNEAFTIVERTKKIRQGEEFYKASSTLLSDSLLVKESELKKQIALVEKKLVHQELKGADNTQTEQALKDSLFQLHKAQDQLLISIRDQIPSYYHLNYTPFNFGIQQCQGLLSAKESLLEYFVGDSMLYVFVVNKDGFHQTSLPLDFSLEQEVEQLRAGIYEYQSVSAENDSLALITKQKYVSAASQLFQLLVQPVNEYLKEEVIVIADGVLNFVPFEALLTKETSANVPFTDMPYWINEKLISYQFSANQMHDLLQREPQVFPKELAAFAPSYQVNTSEVIKEYEDSPSFRYHFHPLLHSKQEVEDIGDIFNLSSSIFQGSSASKNQFLSVAKEYSILHIAAHGKAHKDKGDYSFIAFTADTAKDRIESMLFVDDIYNSTLNNDLIVLSACESGIGELKKGSGVISLSKALSFAGVKSQVSSLWKVEDQFTGTFMPVFYKNLKNGKRKHVALRTAKQSFIKDKKYAAPFYWASFVINGDTRPLPEKNNSNFLFILLLTPILIVSFIAVKRRYRSPDKSRAA